MTWEQWIAQNPEREISPVSRRNSPDVSVSTKKTVRVDFGARQKPQTGCGDKLLPTLKAFEALELPEPVLEHRFHPRRRWRFDIAWPGLKVALEIEGGVWIQGRHNRALGFVKDIEKYNAAAALGWTVLRCLPEWLPGASMDAQLAEHLTRLLKAKQAA